METATVPYKDHKAMPQQPAVYVARDGDTVLYIGSTKNLRQRWMFHHRARWMPANTELTFFTDLSIPLRWYWLAEHQLIVYYDPPLNGKHLKKHSFNGFPPSSEYHVPTLLLRARVKGHPFTMNKVTELLDMAIKFANMPFPITPASLVPPPTTTGHDDDAAASSAGAARGKVA